MTARQSPDGHANTWPTGESPFRCAHSHGAQQVIPPGGIHGGPKRSASSHGGPSISDRHANTWPTGESPFRCAHSHGAQQVIPPGGIHGGPKRSASSHGGPSISERR